MDLSSRIAITVERVTGFPPPPVEPVAPPGNLATQVAARTILFSWSPSPSTNVIGYHVWISVGGSETFAGLITTTSKLFTGLLPETTYTCRITAVSEDNESESVTTTATTESEATVETPKVFMVSSILSVLEGEFANVEVKRTGDLAPLTVFVTEYDNTAGVDHSTVWPGGVVGEVDFPLDADSAIIKLTATVDALTEPVESLRFVITAHPKGGYSLGANTVTVVEIVDVPVVDPADPNIVEFNQSEYQVDEGASVNIRLDRFGSFDSALTVDVTESDNTVGSDYSVAWPGGVSGKVTFAVASGVAEIVLTATEDSVEDPGEAVVFSLLAGAGMIVGRKNASTTTIQDITPPVNPSVISFAQISHSAIEGSAASVAIDRTGGTTSTETVTVTEFDNTDGSDYTVDWPGGVAGKVTFAADSNRAIIVVNATVDGLDEAGESVSFALSPSPTGAYLVGLNDSSQVNILDPSGTTYGESDAEFTAVATATGTSWRSIVHIDPTPANALPTIEVFDGTTWRTADVWPLTYLGNGLCDKIIVQCYAAHAALTGDNVFQVTSKIRQNESATAEANTQYVDVDLSALRFEVRGIPTEGTIVVNPFGLLKKERLGKWSKEQLHFGLCTAAGGEAFGFHTQTMYRPDVDAVIVDVIFRNDLYDPDDVAGHHAVHAKQAGDVYFDSMGLQGASIPAGWEIGHHQSNTINQGGNDFIKSEGGFQVLPARVRGHKRFYLRRTATSTQTEVESAFNGGGLAQVVAGDLAVGKRCAALAHGYFVGRWSDQAEIRRRLEDEWGKTAAKIQEGSEWEFVSTVRVGWWHLFGTIRFREGGGEYLFPAVGFSNETAELNNLRAVFSQQLPRCATTITDSVTGDNISPRRMALTNGGLAPFMQAANESLYESWNPHFRPDSDTVHGAGAANPNIQLKSGNVSLGRSLMPVDNDWSIPGAGATILALEDFWPYRWREGNGKGGPPDGSHHRRWTHCYEGLIEMTGELIHIMVAEEDASHVMECFTYDDVDPAGSDAGWAWYNSEYPMVEAMADITDHPMGRPFWGAHGGGRARANPANSNPAYVHRLAGEMGTCVAIGAAVAAPGTFRDEMRDWAGRFIALCDLRSSPNGWGRRDYNTGYGSSSNWGQSVPYAEIVWGFSNEVDMDGGWPLHFVGQQAFWQMWVADGMVALEKRLMPRIAYPSGQTTPHRRMIIDTFMEQWNRAQVRGRKQISSYGIIVAHPEAGVHPNDAQPEGLLAGTGTGNPVPNWLERNSKPSEWGNDQPVVQPQVTLRDKSFQWVASVASWLEQHPEITDIPILDIARTIAEGVREEDNGAHQRFTYAEAALVCYEGYREYNNFDNVFWNQFYRQRRWSAAGLLQNADYLLTKFPHWGTGDRVGTTLAAPTGFTAEDKATGVEFTWDEVPGAVSYRVDWGELRPDQGPPDGFATTPSSPVAIPGFTDGLTMHMRITPLDANGEMHTSTGLARLQIGSRAIASPDSAGGGGGGSAPATPTIANLNATAGGFTVEITDPATGTQPLVVRVQYTTVEGDFSVGGEAYLQLSSLPRTGETYTASVSGLPEELHHVRAITRDGSADDSSPSQVLTVTPTAGSSGSGGLDGPLNLSVTATANGANMAWDPDNSAGAYYAGWGSTRGIYTDTGWIGTSPTPSRVVSGVPAGLHWFSVQTAFPDATRSDFAEPFWVVSPDKQGRNPYVRPTTSNIGADVPNPQLALPNATWLRGDGAAYEFDDSFDGVVITGLIFDKPVWMAENSNFTMHFVNCEFNSYGPSPDGVSNLALYAIKVPASSGTRVDLTGCTVRYAQTGLLSRGGRYIDVVFEDTGVDGIHCSYLGHDLLIEHCLITGIGNTFSAGNPVNPHGDGVQVRHSGLFTITIRGNDVHTYSGVDPNKPATQFGMSSAVFLETANGVINGAVDISYNWLGSAANSLQIVDDGVGNGPPTNVTCHGNIISEFYQWSAVDSDVITAEMEAYGNTLTDGTNIDGSF